MRRHWPPLPRLLAVIVRRLLHEDVAGAVLRDIDEGYRARRTDDPRAARAWLRRQMLLTLRPGRLRDLRRMTARSLRAAQHVGLATDAGRAIAAFASDLRHALRTLRHNLAFSLLTIAVLTGGLAVSLFTFSFMHTVLHRPLPLPDGDRVVRIVGVDETGRSTMLDRRAESIIERSATSLDAVGSYRTRPLLLHDGQESRAVGATVADPNMFDVAAMEPRIGRVLLPGDAAPGAEPVAVLSHHLWTSAFGADPEIVGARVAMDGIPTRIVGVMPEGYGFPVFGQTWLPMEDTPPPVEGSSPEWVNTYAKLRSGVSREQATVELHELVRRLRSGSPSAADGETRPRSARVVTFQKAQLGDEADLVFALVHLAAGFILLLACVNAGNLVLARGLERGREISIRLALGASRLRLVVQMMAEGTVVTALAGGLAVLVTARALSVFDARAHAAIPEGLAYWWRWGMDQPTLLAAGILIAATLILVGGLPAWRVIRAESDTPLRDAPGDRTDLPVGRLSRSLVVAQIAAIAVLLFMGAMTGTVAYRASQIDFGVDTEDVLVASLSLDDQAGPDRTLARLRELIRRMEGTSAVDGVVLRAHVTDGPGPLAVEGIEYGSVRAQPRAQIRAQMGDPALLGLELLAGRRLDSRDGPGSEPTAVVSASLARELWGGEAAIGRRLRVGSAEPEPGAAPGPWRTVVGVVSDILEGNPLSRERDRKTLYVPMAQVLPSTVAVTFRHLGDARGAITAFHEAVDAVAPELEPGTIRDFDEMFGQMATMTRAASQVLGACFGFALLLAIGGIYGVTSRAVTHRTQEIGIRRALGATDTGILRLFLRRAGRQLLAGLTLATVVAGLASAAVLRFADLDAGTFVGTGILVQGLIAALVLAATYLPARRAVHLDPRRAIWRE